MKINRTNVTTMRKVGKRCGKHGNNAYVDYNGAASNVLLLYV